MTTVIYRRQSKDRNADELGIGRQLKECKRVAQARGETVSQVLTDNHESASKHGRPAYNELLHLMRTGQVDTVLILRVDRLLRLNDELEELIKIVEAFPVKVITCEGDIDLSTPQGRLIARVLVSVARNEIEVKSARQKLANRQRAESGMPHGSRRPYGYEADMLTIRKSEAKILRQMADRILKGHTYQDVAWWANAQGYTTTLGKPWYGVTVRNLIQKPRYGGLRVYKGEVFPAQWPAVFDKATYEALQLTCRLRTEKNVPKARKYLLTGLLVCGKCGSYLNGCLKQDRPEKPIRRIYLCRTVGDTQKQGGCGGVTRGADALEEWITECVFYRLDSPELGELLAPTGAAEDEKIASLLSQRQTVQRRLDGLVDDYGAGLLSKQQLARAKASSERELARINEQLTELTRERSAAALLPAGQSVRQAWENSESDNWRRELLGVVIDKIVVMPGTAKPYFTLNNGKRVRFAPDLINIEWCV